MRKNRIEDQREANPDGLALHGKLCMQSILHSI